MKKTLELRELYELMRTDPGIGWRIWNEILDESGVDFLIASTFIEWLCKLSEEDKDFISKHLYLCGKYKTAVRKILSYKKISRSYRIYLIKYFLDFNKN